MKSCPKIKVIGVGGSGCNAVSRMSKCGIQGIELVGVNTDAQDLRLCSADSKLQIGDKITQGLGAGMNPETGALAAEESRAGISAVIEGADMVFISCGLGGGTGSGASPVIAEIAKEKGALTIAVVTKPFSFEGKQRRAIAEKALEELKSRTDTLLIIPNDKILSLIDKDTTLISAFWACDEILREAVQGISDLIVLPGIINVDFADVKTVMKNSGPALFGTGRAKGEDRAEQAGRRALESLFLDFSIKGAKAVLFNISADKNLNLDEINKIADMITKSISPKAKIIFGAAVDKNLQKGFLKTTVIATGFDQ